MRHPARTVYHLSVTLSEGANGLGSRSPSKLRQAHGRCRPWAHNLLLRGPEDHGIVLRTQQQYLLGSPAATRQLQRTAPLPQGLRRGYRFKSLHPVRELERGRSPDVMDFWTR